MSSPPTDDIGVLAVWCPDWPVVAAERAGLVPPGAAVAVMHAHRVVARSVAARQAGIRQGMRQRDAQRICPQLWLVDADPGRDAVMFEPVVAAVEQVGAGVAVLRPGVCALAARGPVRFFGGQEVAAERIVEQVALDCEVEAQVGIAEGMFAAVLAARASKLVPPGGTPSFLHALPIETLDRPQLTEVLRRLGVTTLGGFADLPGSDVLARFGRDAWLAHRLATGVDDRPLPVRHPSPDLVVEHRFDEPVQRVDTAAFAARMLGEQLHQRLAGYGLVATRLAIEATTVDGQELARVWRHDGVLTAQAIADRARWQLDGWLTRRRLAAGIVVLRLIPDGVVRTAQLAPGLWGEAGEGQDRAHRAMHRVQGILGPDRVVVAVPGGGRHPGEQITLLPWGDQPESFPQGPWPGRLPDPLPSRLVQPPQAVQLRAIGGDDVAVDARLELSGAPATIMWTPHHRQQQPQHRLGVVSCFGPWPVEQRWWDQRQASRVVWLQLVLDDDRAVLVELTDGCWSVVGWFD